MTFFKHFSLFKYLFEVESFRYKIKVFFFKFGNSKKSEKNDQFLKKKNNI